MSNLSRMRRKSTRSAYRSAKSIRYNYGARNGNNRIIKPIPSFLEYSLVNGDIMIIGNIEDMLLQFKHRKDGYISNEIFKVIKCDKVGLFYSARKKMFYWLAVNDDFTIYILFKSQKLSLLPNALSIDIESKKYQIIENANRLIWSVYNRNDILDLTMNPVLLYKVGEIFKR